MAEYVINGCRKLNGCIDIQGAKNSALPVLAATILCRGEVVIHNCPRLTDVDTSVKILRYLGCNVYRDDTTITVDSSGIYRYDIPSELMREMRSSIVFLGAVLGRLKQAQISLPGGCELGPRPIDLHLAALLQMGMTFEENHGILECTTDRGLHSADITLSFPSVGATENIMLAAVCAKGTTTITNAAREHEICDLADFLNSCGARITGAGEGTVYIEGVKTLGCTQHVIIPDRIVTSTYMACVAVSGGKLLLKGALPSHSGSVNSMFEQCGCLLDYTSEGIYISSEKKLKKLRLIRTMPYPGFPTDAQAPVMAMCCFAEGTSVFVENVFESRYKHVSELTRMGAGIYVHDKVAIIEGTKKMSGATVDSQDLRGGAALVVAGLGAEGTTVVRGIHHIERGYEEMEVCLSNVGADIMKI
ncbi:MAG: UDP-N-acetylglucosamine 1-carboxyvinyltransferase [Acutalibacteraceae bacterium]|nr:UDP-N-acetylglucosamine 1-carboxyvinyltransferase [Acutalibacteraceae bacterium]